MSGGVALTDKVGGVGGSEEVGQVQPLDESRIHGDSLAPAPWVVCRWGAHQKRHKLSSPPSAIRSLRGQ